MKASGEARASARLTVRLKHWFPQDINCEEGGCERLGHRPPRFCASAGRVAVPTSGRNSFQIAMYQRLSAVGGIARIVRCRSITH